MAAPSPAPAGSPADPERAPGIPDAPAFMAEIHAFFEELLTVS